MKFEYKALLLSYLVVPLLQGNGQGGEPVLCGERLAGPAGQEEPHDAVVVLLGGHVQGGEAVLALHVDGGAVGHEDLDHLLLPGEAGDVQGRVALRKLKCIE